MSEFKKVIKNDNKIVCVYRGRQQQQLYTMNALETLAHGGGVPQMIASESTAGAGNETSSVALTGSARLRAIVAARRAAPRRVQHTMPPPPPAAKVAETHALETEGGAGAFHRQFTTRAERKLHRRRASTAPRRRASHIISKANIDDAFKLLRTRAAEPLLTEAPIADPSDSEDHRAARPAASKRKQRRQTTMKIVFEAAAEAQRVDRQRITRRVSRSFRRAADKLPTNVSQMIGFGAKEERTDRIEQYVSMAEPLFRYAFRRRLTNGIAFTKHGRRGVPRRQTLKVNSSSELQWQSVRISRIALGTVVGVVAGKSHVVFDRSGAGVPAECCFSLLTPHRSLDLQVDTTAVRDELVYGFRRLLAIETPRNEAENAEHADASVPESSSARAPPNGGESAQSIAANAAWKTK